MDKKVILVTGACGRIGTQVVRQLAKDYQIVGFELEKAIYANNSEELVPIDLSSDESVKQAFSHIRRVYGNRIASVIHLAAYYSFDQQHSDLYDQVTVKGTARLLKALQDFEVDQFIFSSTLLVYKPVKPGVHIVENSPVEPKWDYPLSKVRTEQVIHELRGTMKTVVLRIAGVYDDFCHSIPISHQIQRIDKNTLESHLFSGCLDHGAPFLHMADLVDAIELAVQKRAALPSELMLILGEETTLSYRQLQNQISQLIRNRPIVTFSIPKWIAKIGAWLQGHIPFIPKPFIKPWMIDLADDHYEIDVSLAKRILGWMPKHNLNATLPKMIASLKKDPQDWYKGNGMQ